MLGWKNSLLLWFLHQEAPSQRSFFLDKRDGLNFVKGREKFVKRYRFCIVIKTLL